MNFEISDEQKLVLEVVDEACKKIRPFEDKCYLERRFNDKLIPIFKEAHLLGLPVSQNFGEGQGADALTYALALERIGQEGLGYELFFGTHFSGTVDASKVGKLGSKGTLPAKSYSRRNRDGVRVDRGNDRLRSCFSQDELRRAWKLFPSPREQSMDLKRFNCSSRYRLRLSKGQARRRDVRFSRREGI